MYSCRVDPKPPKYDIWEQCEGRDEEGDGREEGVGGGEEVGERTGRGTGMGRRRGTRVGGAGAGDMCSEGLLPPPTPLHSASAGSIASLAPNIDSAALAFVRERLIRFLLS